MFSYLIDYLLGEDWMVTDPIGHNQINEIALYEILNKYSPKYRKEHKEWRKLIEKRDELNSQFQEHFKINKWNRKSENREKESMFFGKLIRRIPLVFINLM